MNIKKIIKYCLVIGSICLAGYLVLDLISNYIARKQDEKIFCAEKCNHSPYSYFWEFSGEYSTKGFTTKEECLSYCSKSREGFVYHFISDGYSSLTSLISSPPLSDFLELIHLR